MKKVFLQGIILVSVIFITGCCNKNLIKQDYVAFNNDPFAIEPEPDLSDPAAGKRVLILADNQNNNLYSNPDIIRSKEVAKVKSVAVRPPQLDLYSNDMVRWLINSYGKNRYIIHLGDALNIGCQDEWDNFVKVMREPGVHTGWVTVPGNHDSYYYGNVEPNQFDREMWERACNSAPLTNNRGKISDKNTFIHNYLAALKEQHRIFPNDFPFTATDYNSARNRNAHQWSSPIEGSFVKKIALMKYPDAEQHKSFLVQAIDLSRGTNNNVFAILVDTTDYKHSLLGPVLAGKYANLSRDQIRIINAWIAEFKQKNSNMKYIIVGHHQIDELNDEAKEWLSSKVEANDGFLTYIAGHTHSGWVKTGTSIKKSTQFYEMNVGSTTDWSPTDQYKAVVARTLNVKDGKVHSNRIFMKATELIDANDHFDYSAAPGKCYTCYKDTKGSVYSYTVDTLLFAYTRLFKDLKASSYDRSIDPMIAKAETLMNKKCIIDELSSDISEAAYMTPEAQKCFAEKLTLIQNMEKMDEGLKLRFAKYKNDRMLYGANQTVRASKTDYEKRGN